MIDKWNYIHTQLKNQLTEIYTELTTSTVNKSSTPSTFPYMLVDQIGNEMTADDLEGNENAVNCTIELQVYSNVNLVEARNIISNANDIMVGMGFRRIYMQQVSNLSDSNIYRMVGRYRRIICGNDNL